MFTRTKVDLITCLEYLNTTNIICEIQFCDADDLISTFDFVTTFKITFGKKVFFSVNNISHSSTTKVNWCDFQSRSNYWLKVLSNATNYSRIWPHMHASNSSSYSFNQCYLKITCSFFKFKHLNYYIYCSYCRGNGAFCFIHFDMTASRWINFNCSHSQL